MSFKSNIAIGNHLYFCSWYINRADTEASRSSQQFPAPIGYLEIVVRKTMFNGNYQFTCIMYELLCEKFKEIGVEADFLHLSEEFKNVHSLEEGMKIVDDWLISVNNLTLFV